jgi:putative colanic acid biosynthesis acetyltransferase WcaB
MLHGSGVPHRAFLLGVAQKNVLNNIWAAPVLVLYRIITECFFGYEIQAAATIGRRFTIHHGYAVVINKFVVAGMISPFAMR